MTPSRESLPSRKHATLTRPKTDPMAKPTNTMFALSPMSSSPSTETSSFAWFARPRAIIICLSQLTIPGYGAPVSAG